MKNILIVDDQQDIRDLLKDKLMQDHFSVITAASGEEGVALSRLKKPDLILLDIAMPGMDGYSACEKIKSDPDTNYIPVVFLTGKDLNLPNVLERCKELSAAGYISKSSSLKELSDKIREVLFEV